MISSIYKNKNIFNEIKREFKKNKIIKFESFFEKDFYNKLKHECSSLKFTKRKIPDKYSFSDSPSTNAISSLINDSLKDFLEKITDKKISSISIKKFAHKDYTLLHDSSSKDNETKALVFICEKWSPDIGGNFVFKKSEKVFYITPMENSLAIVEKQKDWQEFVQYLNHLSNKKEVSVIEIVLF